MLRVCVVVVCGCIVVVFGLVGVLCFWFGLCKRWVGCLCVCWVSVVMSLLIGGWVCCMWVGCGWC